MEEQDNTVAQSQPISAPKRAAREAEEPAAWVLVPRELTEPMRRACWRQQYIFHGATPEEADMLADTKVADPVQLANDTEGYRAMIAAAPTSDSKHSEGGEG